MKKLVIICCLSLTLGYAANIERETINQIENSKINNEQIEYLSYSEFLNTPFEELY
jgi:DNA-binding XRE family transcriptional regulator